MARFPSDQPHHGPVLLPPIDISPAVIEQYLDGRTIDDFRPRHLRVVKAREAALTPEEQAMCNLLRSRRRRSRGAA